MKKFSKIGKRVFAFFLVALMNINTYATVGANDGSAFVTKAEFDNMVYDFNNKMSEYQSGLNAKIDYAIANYISGLSTVSKIEQDNIVASAIKLCDDGELLFLSKLNINDTRQTDLCVESGEVLFANTDAAFKYVWRYRVYGQDARPSTYKGGNTFGRYYYLKDSNSLLEYWTGTYVYHNVAGSFSHSRTVAGDSVVTIPTHTFMQNRDKVGAFSEKLSATDNNGNEWPVDISCNLSLRKNTVETFKNNQMFANVESKNIYCIYDTEKDDLTKIRTVEGDIYTMIVPDKSGTETPINVTWGMNVNTQKQKLENYKTKDHQINSTDLTNYPVSTAYGASVKLYEGVPFVKCSRDGDLIFDMVWSVNGGESTVTQYTQFGFRKSGFDNSETISTDPSIKTNLTSDLAESGKTIRVQISDVKKDEVYWIKGISVSGDSSSLKIENLVLQYQ